jgi:monovalent cation:H+ antiporter-2, CPA2 family
VDGYQSGRIIGRCLWENTPFFCRDLAYVFVAALLGGLLARKLQQPPILGYIIDGILVGPFTPGPSVQDFRTLEAR